MDRQIDRDEILETFETMRRLGDFDMDVAQFMADAALEKINRWQQPSTYSFKMEMDEETMRQFGISKTEDADFEVVKNKQIGM